MDEDDFDYLAKRQSIKSRFNEIARQNVKSSNVSNLDDDTYLADLLKVLKIKSLVIGVGGAGNNTVSRMLDIDSEVIETLTINTDAHDLYYSNSNKKVTIPVSVERLLKKM